ncbi:MAG: hypothetical protein JO100_05510 [Pseudonocardia sp.]|nr:hypothetical protein [Pseudonocardia sp.]
MSDPHRLGDDVDLDTKDIRDRQGRRITVEYAERAAEEALKIARTSRPALGISSQHSPRMSFRIPEQIGAALNSARRQKAAQCRNSPGKRSNATCAMLAEHQRSVSSVTVQNG